MENISKPSEPEMFSALAKFCVILSNKIQRAKATGNSEFEDFDSETLLVMSSIFAGAKRNSEQHIQNLEDFLATHPQ